MEQTAVGTSADLVDDIGLEITVDGAGNVFAVALCRMLARVSGLKDGLTVRTGLGEEGGEALVVIAGLALLSEVAVRLWCCQ